MKYGMDNREQISIACTWYKYWPGYDGNKELGVIYVNRLYNMVRRNLSFPFRFVCFTDEPKGDFHDDIEIVPTNFAGLSIDHKALGKMIFHKPGNTLTGRVLGFDLDTIIIGNIDDFAKVKHPLVTRRQLSGHSVGGDLIGFDAGNYEFIWKHIQEDLKRFREHAPNERMFYKYLQERFHLDIRFWSDFLPNRYVSYKRYLRINNQTVKERRLKIASIVTCHGKPNPHQLVEKEPWVKEHWR